MSALQNVSSILRKIFTGKVYAYGVFWTWNLLYLVLFVTLEVSSDGMVIGLFRDCIHGRIPLSIFISAIIIYTLPIASIILAATLLRKDRVKILKLFYAVEVPLALFCLLRIWLVREFNPGSFHLYVLVIVALVGL